MDIQRAIDHRLHVTFVYDGQPRIVQPATLGPHAMTGTMSIRGYQVGGRSNSRTPPFWTMFSVDKMIDLVVTGEPFASPPPGYADGDKHIDPIIATL